MIESIKHLLGLCCEPHGLMHYMFTLGGLTGILTYLKMRRIK